MVLLGLAVRFLHWALADGTLLSWQYYFVDLAVLVCCAATAYRDDAHNADGLAIPLVIPAHGAFQLGPPGRDASRAEAMFPGKAMPQPSELPVTRRRNGGFNSLCAGLCLTSVPADGFHSGR